MNREIVRPTNLYDPSFHAYSHGIKAGNMVFVAGQLAISDENKVRRELIGRGDVSAQARQAFKNIEKILETAGAKLENVVTMTVFLKDIRDLDKFCEVRRELFGNEFPASTAVQVSNLANPDALVE